MVTTLPMRTTLILCALVSILFLGPSSSLAQFLPRVPGAVLFEHVDDDLEAHTYTEADGIRALYGALLERVQASGYTMALSVQDVRTYYQDALGTVLMSEILDLPDGQALLLEVDRMKSPKLRQKRVHVAPRWIETDAMASSEHGRMLHRLTFLQAQAMSGFETEKENVVAVSSYSVKLAFSGRKTIYRAAVLWGQPENTRPVRILLQDFKIQNLLAAIDGDAPASRYRSIQEIDQFEAPNATDAVIVSNSDRLVSGNPDSVRGGCETQNWTSTRTQLNDSDATGHYNASRHLAAIRLAATCDCASTCLASCSPYWQFFRCRDLGSVSGPYVHNTYLARELAADQDQTRAVCVGGQGCAIESCIPGFCSGITVTGTVQAKVGVSFSTNRAPLATLNLSDKVVCNCSQLEPPHDPSCGDEGHGHGPLPD